MVPRGRAATNGIDPTSVATPLCESWQRSCCRKTRNKYARPTQQAQRHHGGVDVEKCMSCQYYDRKHAKPSAGGVQQWGQCRRLVRRMEAAGAPRRWPRRRSAQCIIDQRAIGISAAPDQQADDDDSGFDAWRCRRQLARSDDYAVGSDINCGGGAFGQRLTPWRAAIPPANWCAPTLAAIAAA